MLYTPKFCCECSDKIERVDGNWRKSRRFCDSCAADFWVSDKFALIFPVLCLVLGFIGLGSLWQTPEKPLSNKTNQFVSGTQNVDKAETNRTNPPPISSNISVQPPVNAQKDKNATAAVSNLKTKPDEIQAEEPVYFCGAQTKKGTPCSRRVKGGGRCWQHEGLAAMLPAEKLIVSKN